MIEMCFAKYAVPQLLYGCFIIIFYISAQS